MAERTPNLKVGDPIPGENVKPLTIGTIPKSDCQIFGSGNRGGEVAAGARRAAT